MRSTVCSSYLTVLGAGDGGCSSVSLDCLSFLVSASSFVRKDIALANVFLKMILGKSVGCPQSQLVELDSICEHFEQLNKTFLLKRTLQLTNSANAADRSLVGLTPPNVQVADRQVVSGPSPCTPSSEHTTTCINMLSTTSSQSVVSCCWLKLARVIPWSMVAGL